MALLQWPRTGQTACYDENGVERACVVCIIGEGCYNTGDDGYWQQGVQETAQRFTDNGDGAVTDKFTGLMWNKTSTYLVKDLGTGA